MRVTGRTTLLLSIVALVMSTATLLIVVGILPQPHDDAEEPSDPKPLTGTTWLLQSLGPTGNLHPALTTKEATLQFSDDGRVNGQAGCNSYFGQYSFGVDRSLTITGLGSTKMLCHEPGVMQQEQDFLSALAAAERYEVKNGRLHISGGGTELTLSPA